MIISLRFLGDFRIRLNEELVTERLTHRKGRTLLGYLYCATRREIPRDEIYSVFWPDADTDAARLRLNQVVATTRKDLGVIADTLLPRSSSVGGERHLLASSAGVLCDVTAFEAAVKAAGRARTPNESAERWQTAATLYRGPFLPDATEDWAIQERERLSIHHRAALRFLISYHERRGETESALLLARQFRQSYPDDEDAVRDVMRLLTATGKKASALTEYRQFAARRQKIGGETPSAELRSYAAELRLVSPPARVQWEPMPVSAPHHALMHAIPRNGSHGSETDNHATDARRLLDEIRRAGLLSASAPALRPDVLAGLTTVAAALLPEERTALRRRHAQTWVAEVKAASEIWRGPQGAATLNHLSDNTDHLHSALDYLSDANSSEALALAANLHWPLYVRGRYREGRERLENLLRLVPTQGADKPRADALLASGHFANCMGDNRAAFVRYREARALYRRLGDENGIALTLMREGNACMEEGLLLPARRLCHEAATYFRRRSDDPNLVMALFYSHMTASYIDEHELSDEEVSDVAHLANSLEDERYLGLVSHIYCSLFTMMQTPHPKAALTLAEGFRLLQRNQDTVSIIYLIQSAANLSAYRGQKDTSATLLGIIAGLRRIYHHPQNRNERTHPQRTCRPEMLALTAPGIRRAARQRGEDLAHSLPEALRFALESHGE